MDMPEGSLPWQFGGVNAAPKPVRRVLQPEENATQLPFQLGDRVGGAVGERLLCLGPNMFIRIELRRIGGKTMNVKPAAALQVGPHGLVAMDFPAIPQQDDLSTQMPQEQAKEADHPLAVDVVAVHLKYSPIHWRRAEIVTAEMTETLSCR